METREIIALILVAFAAVDALLGALVFVPRAKSAQKRQGLKAMFVLGVVALLGLAGAFWMGWI